MRLTLIASTLALSLASSAIAAESSSWTDKISLKGDFRFRHEIIDDDSKSETRNRQRIRARLNVAGEVNDEFTVGIRLATGGNSPISTNQTLDSSFSTKDIGLDQAYFAYKPSTMEGTTIKGGKFSVPFAKMEKTQLIWDGDLNLEGAAFQHEADAYFFNAGYFILEENSSSKDEMLYGAQIGGTADAGGAALTYGVGYYDYNNLTGMDINILEGFFMAKLSDSPFSFFANYAQNTETSSEDTGYLFGVKHGSAKEPGEWDFTYFYEDLEANAVNPNFTNSDFGGGGTGHKGHVVNVGYALKKNVKFSVTLFSNDKNNAIDYRRAQIDLGFKF